MSRAVADVSTGAIAHNVATLRAELEARTRLCVVVKAEAYGHGAKQVAAAAQRAGADWLAVATAREAIALRGEGVGGRLLVMGALTREEVQELAGLRGEPVDVVAWHPDFVAWLPDRLDRVHVKLDTGMGRLGTRDPAQADAVAEALGSRLAGLMTHFATADERGDAFFDEQLARFTAWASPWKGRRPELILHAANSAATFREPAAHFDLVRCGVAVYGMDPFHEDAAARGLRSALELWSWVGALKACAPGESAGYGRRFVADRPTRIATVPIGYGDGWRRGLTNNGDVLIRGQRLPIAGTVSMDNVTVDVGDAPVEVGDPVCLLGGGITAEEVAARLGTINYEVTTALTARVPRRHG